MKLKKQWLFVLALPLLMFTSCEEDTITKSAEQGKEYTSAYICTMHCEGSGSDEAGTCPVCGMVYVANKDPVDHEGHEHK